MEIKKTGVLTGGIGAVVAIGDSFVDIESRIAWTAKIHDIKAEVVSIDNDKNFDCSLKELAMNESLKLESKIADLSSCTNNNFKSGKELRRERRKQNRNK